MNDKITIRLVDYDELRRGLSINDDRYGIAFHQYETRRKALLANPNLVDYSKPSMFIGVADEIPVGRAMLFPTKIKCGDTIVDAACGSSFEVVEEYRKKAVGADIFLAQTKKNGYDFKLSAGISGMALPLNKAMRYTIFEFPKFIQFRSSRLFLSSLVKEGMLMRYLCALLNLPFKLVNKCQMAFLSKNNHDLSFEKVTQVPEWIDDVVLDDGHQYTEYHDHKWLQWNLDYNFNGHPLDKQSFYIVKKDGMPCGFFMTKERFLKKKFKFKKVLTGAVVEWGVKKDLDIHELAILKLAMTSFSKRIDYIEVASNDEKTSKRLRKLGFMHRENANISFKDLKSRFPDSKDINNWRIRLGYADVIMSSST